MRSAASLVSGRLYSLFSALWVWGGEIGNTPPNFSPSSRPLPSGRRTGGESKDPFRHVSEAAE
jgi:hypothetical protein